MDLIAKALYATADLMEARDQVMGDPEGKHEPCGVLLSHGFLAAHGVTTTDEWHEKNSHLRVHDRPARKAWFAEGDAIYEVLADLLAPHGQNSPYLTAATVRAIADQYTP